MPPPDEYIGKTVANKYVVESMLGEGGMGKVYKANQTALDKPVVLKVLRQALLADERTVERFKREAKAASRLNHQNSIQVLDFGQAEDGAMYIAMEYVQGKDLHHILTREWPLPEARVLRIMSQVLSALADAHNAGVVHRDLKPENIMVEQRRGEADFVKVLDFGIAKIVDGTDDEGPALTRAGFVCGTPEYMSPEQARGAKLDHRSDLYAVGVILYQLVTGMLPFDSDSAVGFATKHLIEMPQPPSKRRPDAKISAAMERLVLKAMSKSPDERPQTAELFRSELLAIEKERRAAVGTRARPMATSASAGNVPPLATPTDQQATRAADSPWANREDTVKSGPPQFATKAEQTESMSRPGPVKKRNLTVRYIAIGLSVVAVALIGTFAFQSMRGSKDAFVPPNASQASGALWEVQLAASARRVGDAARLTSDGDEAIVRGNPEFALQKYLEAWQADTTPELALKIGELYFQQDKIAEAKGWWGRFRKDSPTSRAVSYIDSMLPSR